MISIVKAKEGDSQILTDIGRASFQESHGSSAVKEEIEMYLNENYTADVFKNELSDPENIYHIIFYNEQPAGYSKIILNVNHANIGIEKVTKLERLYLLKKFYDLRLGFELFKFNIELSKKNDQAGMWLFVWKENHRAVNFYKNTGFKIIGSYEYKLTDTHSNPNYQMLLKY